MRGRLTVGAGLLGVSAGGLVGLTGCGAPAGLAPAAYAQRACSAVAAYEATLTPQAGVYTAAVMAAGSDPAKLKAAAVTFLREQVAGTTALLATVTALPRPAGSGGAAVRAALVTGVTTAQSTFAVQQMRVVETSPADRAGLYMILNVAQSQVGTAGQAIENGIASVGTFGDRALNDAFAQNDTCSQLAGSSVSTGSSGSSGSSASAAPGAGS